MALPGWGREETRSLAVCEGPFTALCTRPATCHPDTVVSQRPSGRRRTSPRAHARPSGGVCQGNGETCFPPFPGKRGQEDVVGSVRTSEGFPGAHPRRSLSTVLTCPTQRCSEVSRHF